MEIFLNEAALVMGSLSFVDILFLSLILVLIISFVTLIYFIKVNKNMFNTEIQKKEETKEIEEENDNGLNYYEDDQEKTAIISYSELMKNAHNKKIVYEDENEQNSAIDIRKISVQEEEKKDINYQSEEEFLKKLKDLTRN